LYSYTSTVIEQFQGHF